MVRATTVALALMACTLAEGGPRGYAETRAAYRTSETTVTDRHGEVVQVVRTDHAVRRLAWTPLAEVSPALRSALVLSEDRRFREHAGVDWKAVGAAAWDHVGSRKTRGASTITMQLAGLLDDDLRAGSGGRSIAQKLSQAAAALAIEKEWTKDEILEAYLNLVGYRGEIVGVAALSATLFEKYPSGLDAREAAIAAALVRAPNATAAKVAERACRILEAQSLSGDCRGLADYTAVVLARKASPRLDSDPQLAPHFARAVLRRQKAMDRVIGASTADADPATIATSLDARLQRFARTTLRRHLAELADRNVEDGAAIVLDNATGEVLAWVGSSGDLSGAADVDHVTASRQAGSTLKPFLYELAIEKRWLTAASILDDSPVDLATGGGLYIPQNYDHDFKGPVSVRTALASSLNVPAVRTLVIVTPERFHQRLRALGISTLRESGDYYGYALALGSAEVTLADLTNAYRTLANGGTAGPIALRPVGARSAGRPVMDGAAAAIVTDILADRTARATTFGIDSVLSSRSWAAVKTGTSKDLRDNWCIGFTRRYTVGVWVGNSSGESMWDVSGTTGAAPVWRALVDHLGRIDGSTGAPERTDGPAATGGVVRRAITFDGGLEASRTELFLPGTESTRIVRGAARASATNGASGAIRRPVDGTIVAIDPDIPARRQRMTFEVADHGVRGEWRLDGRVIGRGPRVEWPVWPGRHTLERLDAQRASVGRVAFEVRGADVRMALARRSPVP